MEVEVEPSCQYFIIFCCCAVMHRCDTIKWRATSSSMWTGRLQPGNCMQSWILALMHWKWWWQYWNIAMCAPGCSCKCSHMNRNNTVYKFVWRWRFPVLYQCWQWDEHWVTDHYTLGTTLQLISHSWNSPLIKSKSLQFREKEVIKDHIKSLTKFQLNDS